MPEHAQYRQENGPHGAKRWVNLRTGVIQYRDPGTAHPQFVSRQKEQRSRQEQQAKEHTAGHEQGHLSEPKSNHAKVVDTAEFEQHIKQHKTPELFRGVPKQEHADQFKSGDLRQGKGAYGPGIYVGYGTNGRDTANKAAGEAGVMARMTLTPDAKVMPWDEAETTWENEGKQEFSIEKYDGTEKAIAAWAKSKGVDALDVKHNEYMNVLNPKALIVERPRGDDESREATGATGPSSTEPTQAGGNPKDPAPMKSKKKSQAKMHNKQMLNAEVDSAIGISADDIPSLVGAPDDAIVTITGVEKKDKQAKYKVAIRNKDFNSDMEIGVDHHGKRFLHIDGFWVKQKSQGSGLGTDIFARQVENATDAQFDYIKLHAAKDNPMDEANPHNGYYTWPRYGFDADIDDLNRGVAGQIRSKFPKADSILDVMSSREGRDWWKANGSDLYETRFDMKQGSRSMQIFGAYLEEREKRKVSQEQPATFAKEEADGPATMHLADWEEAALDAAWERIESEGWKEKS